MNHIIVHLTQQGIIKPHTAQLSLNVAGRLGHFLSNWQTITIDKWVIKTIQDFQILFFCLPVQEQQPSPPISSKSLNTRGGECPSTERCGDQSTQPSTLEEFLFNSLPSSQERGSDETSNQPQEVERMGGAPTLQDGGLGDTKRVTEGKRLDGEGGSQRCLLHSSNSCDSPTHALIPGGTGTLPVHMPAFWPVMCTLGIHQSDETSDHSPLEHGSLHDYLYR